MDTVYIEAGRPLYRGSVSFTNNMRGIRWFSKNITTAAEYGGNMFPIVYVYHPVRRLRLLKLTYRTVQKILGSLDPNKNKNLINALKLTWSPSRVSVFESNVKAYTLIRNKFGGFDGTWSPTLRSSVHGKFPSEIVLFRPNEVIRRVGIASQNNINKARYNKGKNVRLMRMLPRPRPILGPGKKFFNENTSVINSSALFNKRA